MFIRRDGCRFNPGVKIDPLGLKMAPPGDKGVNILQVPQA